MVLREWWPIRVCMHVRSLMLALCPRLSIHVRCPLPPVNVPGVVSATNQFFINLVDNKSLNAGGNKAGYAVFGKVLTGMDVVEKVATSSTGAGDVPTA